MVLYRNLLFLSQGNCAQKTHGYAIVVVGFIQTHTLVQNIGGITRRFVAKQKVLSWEETSPREVHQEKNHQMSIILQRKQKKVRAIHSEILNSACIIAVKLTKAQSYLLWLILTILMHYSFSLDYSNVSYSWFLIVFCSVREDDTKSSSSESHPL